MSFRKDEDVVDYQFVMFHCLSLSILFLSTDTFQHVVGKDILTAAVAVTDAQESLCQHHVLVSSMVGYGAYPTLRLFPCTCLALTCQC